MPNGIVATNSGAGSIRDSSCNGHPGLQSYEQSGACIFVSGGGGGGAAAGSSGGLLLDADPSTAIAGGPSFGTDDLQPLVGGCAGGGFHSNEAGVTYTDAQNGGGAIQLTSRSWITVTGTINMDGYGGYSDQDQGCRESWLAGGGGGGILLEAPVVTLTAHSTLSAAGGDGYGCNPAQQTCGTPGHGGTGATAATGGGNVQFTTALEPSAIFASGTGAGGVGRVRINTATSTYTLDASATRNAIVTTGTIKTR